MDWLIESRECRLLKFILRLELWGHLSLVRIILEVGSIKVLLVLEHAVHLLVFIIEDTCEVIRSAHHGLVEVCETLVGGV
jgi:hypothetical protein